MNRSSIVPILMAAAAITAAGTILFFTVVGIFSLAYGLGWYAGAPA